MPLISIRLPEGLLQDLDKYAQKIHVKRAEYIRKAIECLNREISKKTRDKHLRDVSLRVRDESMRINQEFSSIEDDDEKNSW